jgi:hypothetical protein
MPIKTINSLTLLKQTAALMRLLSKRLILKMTVKMRPPVLTRHLTMGEMLVLQTVTQMRPPTKQFHRRMIIKLHHLLKQHLSMEKMLIQQRATLM